MTTDAPATAVGEALFPHGRKGPIRKALAAVSTFVALCAAGPAAAHAPFKHTERLGAPVLHHIKWLRPNVNGILKRKCRPVHPVGIIPAWRIPQPMRPWVRNLWQDRRLAALRASDRCNNVAYWIEFYFGSRAGEAKIVAECESTVGRAGRFAVNGQYVGIFQMGEWERENYGWYTVGAPAQVQVRSAHNYFVATGRDWGAWDCKP